MALLGWPRGLGLTPRLGAEFSQHTVPTECVPDEFLKPLKQGRRPPDQEHFGVVEEDGSCLAHRRSPFTQNPIGQN